MAKSRQLANTSSLGTVSNVIVVPTGTTAQRPSATAGYIRYNTDLNSLESANGTAWANVGSGSTSSGGGVSWQAVQNTSFIAVSGNGYLVNTRNSGVVVTLPATPTLGSYIQIVDYSKTASANAITIYPNGNKLNANTANVTMTNNGSSVALVYADTIQGWVAFNGFNVSPVGNYSIDYLVVAGGGGGGNSYGQGGGGGGGLLTSSAIVVPGTSYTITVGAGGSGSPGGSPGWTSVRGSNGGDSTLSTIVTSLGGGGGAAAGISSGTGVPGGSGGGGGYPSAAGGAGTNGQGYPGGAGITNYGHGGGGGGGAGGSGGVGATNSGGTGGIGAASTISGSSVYYAGGGGGCFYDNNGAGAQGNYSATGGLGGGGAGGVTTRSAGTAGTTNTGGGGGASGGYEPQAFITGASGGSGIVIIRYLGIQRATGGTISSSGGYTIHTFSSSGTFTA